MEVRVSIFFGGRELLRSLLWTHLLRSGEIIHHWSATSANGWANGRVARTRLARDIQGQPVSFIVSLSTTRCVDPAPPAPAPWNRACTRVGDGSAISRFQTRPSSLHVGLFARLLSLWRRRRLLRGVAKRVVDRVSCVLRTQAGWRSHRAIIYNSLEHRQRIGNRR